MSESAPSPAPVMPSSSRLIATLGIIAMLSGLFVVVAFEATAPRIEHNKRESLQRAVFRVLPGATVRSNFVVDASAMVSLSDADLGRATLFGGYTDDGTLVGYAIEGAARGYQDVVRVLYGYDPVSQTVIGYTVLQSTETPGLGDKIISDPAFLANFKGLDMRLNDDGTALRNEVVAVKNGKKTEAWQIDGISGATISSLAVAKGIRESSGRMLPLLRKHTGGSR